MFKWDLWTMRDILIVVLIALCLISTIYTGICFFSFVFSKPQFKVGDTLRYKTREFNGQDYLVTGVGQYNYNIKSMSDYYNRCAEDMSIGDVENRFMLFKRKSE